MTNYEVGTSRWLIALGTKFARVVPVRTSLVILLTLVSQISHLLAFFLPLKIVILLGSDGMPRYFPESFAQFDRDFLVMLLGIATVGFFLTYSITERVIDRVTTGAARLLMERSQKLVIFENQNDIAGGAYQGFAKALAGLVFCLLTLSALAVVYLEMAVVMGGYLALVTIVLLCVCSVNGTGREWVSVNLSALMGNLSALGFFAVFGYLVVDFVFLQPPGILVAILSILAGRLSFGRIASAVIGLYQLYRQREKLEAIFFHGRPLLSVITDKPGSLWHYLSPEERDKWVAPLLQEFCGADLPERAGLDQELKWQHTVTSDVGSFIYRRAGSVFLLKMFAKNRNRAAQHEATLLADAPKGLPAPHFLGISHFNAFPCCAYQVESGKVVNRRRHKLELIRLQSQMLEVEIPEALVKRYLRSMPTLFQRMSTHWLERVIIAAVTDNQKAALDGLHQNWQFLIELLATLPLVIYNPASKPGVLWQAESSGDLCLLHWEKWSLEPAGAGWPVQGRGLEQLIEAHQNVCPHREALQSHPPEHLVLAALTFELERLVKNQKLDVAVRTASRLWDTLELVVIAHNSEH